MLASIGDDYFLTNSRSWKCTVTYSTNWMQPTFNDATWPAAVFVKPNSQRNRFHRLLPEISARATWIWTRDFYRPIDPVVYCRGRLRMLQYTSLRWHIESAERQYINTAIGTLAVDGWLLHLVQRGGSGRAVSNPVPSSLYQM